MISQSLSWLIALVVAGMVLGLRCICICVFVFLSSNFLEGFHKVFGGNFLVISQKFEWTIALLVAGMALGLRCICICVFVFYFYLYFYLCRIIFWRDFT